MALGLGAIVGGIAAIAGLYKSSKSSGATSIPAPTMPELTAEQKALQSTMAAMSEYELKQAFSSITGGMDIDKYNRMTDALAAKDMYDYRSQLAKQGLLNALNGKTPIGTAQNPTAQQDYSAQQKAMDTLRQTAESEIVKSKGLQGAVGTLGFTSALQPEIDKYVETHWPLEYQKYAEAKAKASSGISVTVAGKPLTDLPDNVRQGLFAIAGANGPDGNPIQLTPQMVTDVISSGVLDKADITIEGKNYKANEFFSGPQIQTIADRASIEGQLMQVSNRLGRATEGTPEFNSLIDSKTRLENSLKVVDQKAAENDPIKNYFNNPNFVKETGMTQDELNKTLSDIGLYNPSKGTYYSSFQQAVDDNGGAIPKTADINGVLAYRVQLESAGKLGDAKGLDTIVQNSPQFKDYYDKYFDPEQGLWTAKNPLEKYKDPNIPKPEWMSKLESTVGTRIDKIFAQPSATESNLAKTGEAQFGKAGALLDQALSAGAKTDAAAQQWLQDRLTKGMVTPAEFDQASALLKQVPGVLAKLDPMQQTAQQNIGALNNVVSGAISKDWSIQNPTDQRREGVINQLTTQATTGQPEVTPGADPYRQKALDALLNKATSTTNPFLGMSDAEVQARRDAAAVQNKADLQAGQATLDEGLAKRNALDSSQGNVERARLLNEVIGQRNTELTKTLEAERMQRAAEAAAQNQTQQTAILNNLSAAGQQNIDTGLQAQQFNAQQKQALMQQILSATDANTQNAIKTGQINLDALVQKVGAANQSAAQQAQTLAQTLGVTVEQANTILKTAQTNAEIGQTKTTSDVQGTQAMTGVANTAANAANQNRETGIKAADTAAQIGTAATGAQQNLSSANATTMSGQAGLLNAVTGMNAAEYERQQFNQLQPMEMEIAKQNALDAGMQTASGIINSALNQNNNVYQGQLNTWQSQVAAATADANRRADSASGIANLLTSFIK